MFRAEMRTQSVMVTDPLLVGFSTVKQRAFSEAHEHLNEVERGVDKLIGEVTVFKNKVLKTLQESQDESSLLSNRRVLIIEQGKLQEEYSGFILTYVKISTLTYRVQETINYLNPAYRSANEERIFQENAPNFHAQNQELDRQCAQLAERLQDLCTKVLRQKANLYSSIYDFALTRALDKLRALAEMRESPSSKGTQLYTYFSSYVSPPEETSYPPNRQRQRASLTDPGPSASGQQSADLAKKPPGRSVPVSSLNIKRTPLSTLTASPGSSSSRSLSPRFLDVAPVAGLRRHSVDSSSSWTSIALDSTSRVSPRLKNEQTSSSYSSSKSYSQKSTAESSLTARRVTPLNRSYGQDAGSSSRETYKKLRSSPELERSARPVARRQRELPSSPGLEPTQAKITSYIPRGREQGPVPPSNVATRKKLSSSGEDTSLYPRILPHPRSERVTPSYQEEERRPRQRGLTAQELLSRDTPSQTLDATRKASQKPASDKTKRLSLKKAFFG